MRALLLILGFSLLSCTVYAQSEGFVQDCAAHLPATHVLVRVTSSEAKIDTMHTLAEINRMDPQPPPTQTLGFTHARISPQFIADMPTWQASGSTQICGSPQIDIAVNFESKLYVASEFPVGSCAYNAILAHEQKHVAVLRNFGTWAQQNLTRDIEALVGTNFMVGATQPEMHSKLDHLLNPFVHARVAEWLLVLRSKQHDIDTPEEYRRVAALCMEFQTLKRPASW